MKLFSKDRDLYEIETGQGKLTLLGLLWPILLENILRNLLSTVNTVLLSHFSEGAVTAVGIASSLLSIITMLHYVIAAGAAVVISQNLGAGNRKKASYVGTVTIFFMGLISIVLSTIIFVFARPLLELMNLDESLMEDGLTYLRITVGFSIFEGFITAFSSIARSYGDTRASMIAMFVMNGLNALGSWLVIYRPIEIPFYGVKGVALLREYSIIISLVLFLFMLKHTGMELDLHAFREKPFSIFWEVLQIGIPGGITFFSYDFSQLVSTSMIAAISMSAVAAKQYVNNIVMYAALAGSSLGSANGIMIGWLVGAGELERAYKINLKNLKIAMFLHGLFSIVLYIFRYQVLSIFSPTPETMELAQSVLLIDFFVEVGRAMNNVGDSALSSTGDVKFSMYLNIVSCWVFSIGFSYIFGILMGMGLFGCWISFAMDELFRGTMNLIRWRSRKWVPKAEKMRKNTGVNY